MDTETKLKAIAIYEERVETLEMQVKNLRSGIKDYLTRMGVNKVGVINISAAMQGIEQRFLECHKVFEWIKREIRDGVEEEEEEEVENPPKRKKKR